MDDDSDNLIQVEDFLVPIEQKETYKEVNVSEELDEKQTEHIMTTLKQFCDVLTDLPGLTDLVEHTVHLTTAEPVRSKAYPEPYAMRETIKSEIDTMLQMGIIEPSESPYASPIVIVKKQDGSIRFCIDFRKLNRVTVIDPEPIPNVDELLIRISNAKWFTKLDLTKGYWQIVVASNDKCKTAFISNEGLYQFKVLPFGMVNSSATFTRMMRKLLKGLKSVVNYIDDVLIFTTTYDEHVFMLNEVFRRLRDAGLTARPTKCFVGYHSLDFLGHMVGEGLLKPQSDKVNEILEASIPKTKKEVRSFLGLVGYYRKFIPHFAAIAVPLTDLTKSKYPNKVRLEEPQERAFQTLKCRIATSPILHLPDIDKVFILQTDASDVGLGAVLLQEFDGTKFPIHYASKKLLPREVAYSVVERECLALVWAVTKFHVYLYGRQFILETDHYPLTYLSQAKLKNSRIMRWALCLQQYRYTIRAIKGSDNCGADFLSRCGA
ncbi:hypothetical protein HOLleu_42443 [Holothuria leucospilota]|uniref:Reverse transcriptase domain-containing protein n=1 Tax=Holothuria leucospilota TaxID=206669 RepID=A0A9Q0YAV2_HOLLE|nr:hypothetical protein HOLleu_42443 [Holothuria leucospilota]